MTDRPSVSLLLLAVVFVGAGVLHFVIPATYAQIVPPGFGPPRLMVQLTGIAEIAGGVGALVPPLRRAAGIGLIALLIAVFPANVYMATHAERFASIPSWTLWLRLPLQFALVAWVWRTTIRASSARASAADRSPRE